MIGIRIRTRLNKVSILVSVGIVALVGALAASPASAVEGYVSSDAGWSQTATYTEHPSDTRVHIYKLKSRTDKKPENFNALGLRGEAAIVIGYEHSQAIIYSPDVWIDEDGGYFWTFDPSTLAASDVVEGIGGVDGEPLVVRFSPDGELRDGSAALSVTFAEGVSYDPSKLVIQFVAPTEFGALIDRYHPVVPAQA